MSLDESRETSNGPLRVNYREICVIQLEESNVSINLRDSMNSAVQWRLALMTRETVCISSSETIAIIIIVVDVLASVN